MPEAKCYLSWKDPNTVDVGTDFGEGSLTESGYPRIAKKWKRGTPLSQAQTIFEGEKSDVSADCYVINTPERQYEVIYRAMTMYTAQVYIIEDGQPVRLDGSLGEYFTVDLKDNFEGMVEHYFMVQGSIE